MGSHRTRPRRVARGHGGHFPAPIAPRFHRTLWNNLTRIYREWNIFPTPTTKRQRKEKSKEEEEEEEEEEEGEKNGGKKKKGTEKCCPFSPVAETLFRSRWY